jgi:plastocyanin
VGVALVAASALLLAGSETPFPTLPLAPAAPTLARAAWAMSRPPTMQAEEVKIEIHDFQYSTPDLTVPVGTTVTWVNFDIEPHTITSRDRVFRSPGLDINETFGFRFDTPGTYGYFCSLHREMTGQVVAQ